MSMHFEVINGRFSSLCLQWRATDALTRSKDCDPIHPDRHKARPPYLGVRLSRWACIHFIFKCRPDRGGWPNSFSAAHVGDISHIH